MLEDSRAKDLVEAILLPDQRSQVMTLDMVDNLIARVPSLPDVNVLNSQAVRVNPKLAANQGVIIDSWTAIQEVTLNYLESPPPLRTGSTVLADMVGGGRDILIDLLDVGTHRTGMRVSANENVMSISLG